MAHHELVVGARVVAAGCLEAGDGAELANSRIDGRQVGRGAGRCEQVAGARVAVVRRLMYIQLVTHLVAHRQREQLAAAVELDDRLGRRVSATTDRGRV